MAQTNTSNIDLLYCFSDTPIIHLEDEFYIVRYFESDNLVCRTLRTSLVINFFA